MRGEDIFQESLFTTIQLETFVPAAHPLRSLRALLDEAMGQLSGLFDSIYTAGGRESIPPERLIRAQFLQVLYSIAVSDNSLNKLTTTCSIAGLSD